MRFVVFGVLKRYEAITVWKHNHEIWSWRHTLKKNRVLIKYNHVTPCDTLFVTRLSVPCDRSVDEVAGSDPQQQQALPSLASQRVLERCSSTIGVREVSAGCRSRTEPPVY